MVSYSQNGMLFNNKTKWKIATFKNNHKCEWKKPNTREYILYDSIYLKLKNTQNKSVVLNIQIVIILGDKREYNIKKRHKGDFGCLFLNLDVDYIHVFTLW